MHVYINGLHGGADRRLGQEMMSSTPVSSGDEPVVVAIDNEWTRDPTNPHQNRVVVYGFRASYRGKARNFFYYPKAGGGRRSRLAFAGMLGRSLARCIPDILPSDTDHVVVVGHFNVGDIGCYRDGPDLMRKVDNVKGRFTSSRGSARLDVPVGGAADTSSDDWAGMVGHRIVRVPDAAGGTRQVSVTFRDTSLLTVDGGGGGSLEALGELLGLPKVELPEGYDKSRMDRLFRDRKAEGERYLGRDLEIPIAWYERLHGTMGRIGIRGVPPTLAAAAVAKFRLTLRDLRSADGLPVTYERVFAVERRKQKVYSKARGHYFTRSTTEVDFDRRATDPIMAEAYHGGRTEVFETGPSEPGELLHDIDKKNAYPTAQGAIRIPDYAASFETCDPLRFTADTLGAARVRFDTPAHLAAPVFPVVTPYGLVFPRRGEAFATAPEIATALHLGVAVTVLRGRVIPWARGDARPFLEFARVMSELRNSLKRQETSSTGETVWVDTVESLVVKTMTNSLYGKTAQAVHPRNVFDSRTGADRPLPPSPVTNAAFAAYTTGLVRAAIAEMVNSVRPPHRVISISTDGFVTTAALDMIDVSGPACSVLSESRRLICGDPGLLEYKRRALQLVTSRGRATFTAMPAPGSKPILAKGSIKVPREEASPNDYLLGVYLNRDPDTRIPREDLLPLRELWTGEKDLVAVDRNPLVSLEPDHKRRLVDARMVRIGGKPFEGKLHVATRSVPHETAEAMVEERGLAEGWRHGAGGCLKTMADWEDWIDYRESTLAARAAGRRPRRSAGGSADELKRQFLRAIVRGEWGVGIGRQSYARVAAWLTEAGYAASLTAVKNAARDTSVLTAHSVAKTDKTVALLSVILRAYPEFDFRKAFVSGHVRALVADPAIAPLLREPGHGG